MNTQTKSTEWATKTIDEILKAATTSGGSDIPLKIEDGVFEIFRPLARKPLSSVKISAIREWARDKALAPITTISTYTLDNVFYLDIIRGGLLSASGLRVEKYKEENKHLQPKWLSSASSWDVVIKRAFNLFSLVHDIYCSQQYDVLTSVYNEETERLHQGFEYLLLRRPSTDCRGISTTSSA